MLKITADMFSGRPNPSSIVTDEAEVRAALNDLARDSHLTLDSVPETAGLGLRGFRIEPMSDDMAKQYAIGRDVFVPVGAASGDSRANEIAERLIALMERGTALSETGDATAADAAILSYLRSELKQPPQTSMADTSEAPPTPAAPPDQMPKAITCMIELSPFNPGFWNNDPNVRAHNNCYNYASNKRTNTFAQPGRGCGHQYTAITCAEVTRAALCDGLHHRFECFADTEKPRYLVAMVVAPGPGFIDYHWYRKQKEGFWGHKPGGTAARNVDNSNHVIMDPRTCDRGPYTQFCGFFYTCRSQRIN